MANGRKLNAKYKVNQAKNSHKYKDQHVPFKIHVQEKKNMIQTNKGQIKKPQRLQNGKFKIHVDYKAAQ